MWQEARAGGHPVRPPAIRPMLASLATLVGSGDRYLWPQTHDLRRIPLREPTPVYAHMLLSRTGDRHPVLTALRDHLRSSRQRTPDDVWLPAWMDR